MYSLIDVNNEENKKTKRIVKNPRNKEYIDVLFNKKLIRNKIVRSQSKLHKLGICKFCKISLSYFDDKRYILDDSINSLSYFHKDILRE